jgi:NADH-quinone oxidoreductase subunit M
MSNLLIPIVLFLPIVGAALLMFVPKEEDAIARGVAFGTSLLTFFVSLGLVTGFKTGPEFDRYQLVFDRSWIPGIGAHFKVGVDGISLWFVMLTTFLTPIVLLSSWKAVDRRVREFSIAFLILETGMIGAFVAIDLFLFYVMWEVMLIPMYFIIGIWGGDARRRVYASIKFVIFTMVGSLLMLVAIFYLYTQHKAAGGAYTFDLASMVNLQLPKTAQIWCFLAFGLAFAIKVPIFPLHTWLPDAHVEAPTAGSVILAGVLLKFGIYGFIRFAMPLFPYASHVFGPWMYLLAVIGIVYGALTAFVQEDVKKLVAYSSVSHLGFCVLGLFALNTQGLEGSIYAGLSHGFTTSGLFLAIGVLYERRHTRKLAEYGGVWARMPLFAGFFMIVTLGSAGLPGLSGFVGEFLSLIGACDGGRSFSIPNHPYIAYPQAFTTVATTGVILGAVYLLTMYQKVMFGPITRPANDKLKDLSAREIFVFVPIVAGTLILGLFPRPLLTRMEPSVARMRQDYIDKLTDDASTLHFWRDTQDDPVIKDVAPTPASQPATQPAQPPAQAMVP